MFGFAKHFVNEDSVEESLFLSQVTDDSLDGQAGVRNSDFSSSGWLYRIAQSADAISTILCNKRVSVFPKHMDMLMDVKIFNRVLVKNIVMFVV